MDKTQKVDKGHAELIYDLEALLQEARAFEFHDFANNKYAAPKMELVGQLSILVENVKNGKYDNSPEIK